MITNVMFHKIAMNHVNTNIQTSEHSIPLMITLAAPHNLISYSDENCDSASVSQLLVTHLHLYAEGDSRSKKQHLKLNH